jgi:uncharacterized protein
MERAGPVLHFALSAAQATSEDPPVPRPSGASRCLLAALGASAALLAAAPIRADPLLTYPLKIKGHTLRAELARTEEEKRTGLMFRKQLGESNAMVFVYEREGRWAMWMKNTTIPLSVAFIDRNGRILNIEDMAPLTLESHEAAGPAKYALEVNQGWFARRGIQAGDRVQGLEKLPRE